MRAKRDAVAPYGELRILVFGVHDVSIRARVTYRLNNVPRFEKTAPSVKTTSDRNVAIRLFRIAFVPRPRVYSAWMLFRDYRDSLSRLCDVYRNVTVRGTPARVRRPRAPRIKSSGNKRLEQKASLTHSNNE